MSDKPILLRNVQVMEDVHAGDHLTSAVHRDGVERYHKTRNGEPIHATAYKDADRGYVAIGAENPMAEPCASFSEAGEKAKDTLRRNLISARKQIDTLLAELDS